MKLDVKEKTRLILGSMVLIFLTGILFIRCFYSFSWSDESFYLAEVHRLYLGDRPFVDEWHPTQFYAILLLPLYRLYVSVNGSTEGIYLAARIFNLVLAFFAAEVSYITLRRYFMLENWLGIVGGAMVVLYNMGNVGGLSYHNFFFYCNILAVMLLFIGVSCYRTKTDENKYIIFSCISGGVSGMAIITVPTCALGMGIVYVVLMVGAVKTKTIRKCIPAWFHLSGIVLVGIIYLFTILSKVSVVDLWEALPFLFLDESHHQKEFGDVLRNIWWVISFYGKELVVVSILIGIVRLFTAALKRAIGERERVVVYLLIACICMYSIYRRSDSHMSAYVIFSLAGIGLFCLEGSKKIVKEFVQSDANVFFVIPALITMMSFLLASATIAPAYQGGVYICLMYLVAFSKIKRTFLSSILKKIVSGATAVCLVVMISMLLYIRIFTVYRDAPLQMIDTVITKGPAKGLWTTKEHVEQYNDCMEIMHYVNSAENCDDDSILISVLAPWMYVCTEVRNGGISPWRIYLDEPLMKQYYKYHDIENLKYVVVLNKDVGNYVAAGTPEGTDQAPNENKEGFIYDYIKENSYMKIGFKSGMLYMIREVD